MNKLTKQFSGTMKKIGFKIKKHSPEILIASGVVGTVVSTVMACKATTKVSSIIEESKETLNVIHEGMDKGEIEGQEYTVEDGKKDTTIVYVQTGVKLVKLYLPSVVLGTLSLTGIIASHKILKKRNLYLAAAYTAVDKGFKQYRKRVVERYGDEVDKELRFGIKEKTIEEKKVDKNGKEKTVEKKVKVIDGDLPNEYARWFDKQTSTAYEDDNHCYNLTFLRAKEAWANDQLKANHFVYLNDIYYELGMEKTKAGQIVGWKYDPDDKSYQGDGFIDFGIHTIMRENENGEYEEAILLDFNPDGNILDLMD